MLILEQASGDVSIDQQEIRRAALMLAQGELVRTAKQTNLELYQDSFHVFSNLVQQAIDNPAIALTSTQLVTEASLLALRGAQEMVAHGESRFHEGTWSDICPLWPFC